MEKTTNITEIERVTVSAEVLKKILLFKDDSRVRQLASEGIFIRASKGRYLLLESIQNYIKTLKIQKDIQTTEQNSDVNYEVERAKLEQVKRMQAELKLALMKGDLHESKDVEAVMTDMLARIRSRFLHMPTKLAPLLAEKDTEKIKKMLSDEIRDILEELKEYDPKDFQSDEFVELEEFDD